MKDNLSLDLKYRPNTLDDMWGNDLMVKELKTQIVNKTLPHLIVFIGPYGTGKTSTAYVLDKAISCQRRDEYKPCCSCARCRKIDEDLFGAGESIPNMGVFRFEMGSKTAPEYIQTTMRLLDTNINSNETIKIHLDELQIASFSDQDRLNNKLEFVLGNKNCNKYVFITAPSKQSIHPGILQRARVYYLERPDITEQVNRAYTICQQESIPLTKKKLRELVLVSESPRVLIKNLEAIKYGSVGTIDRLLTTANSDMSLYIEYFKAIKLGIHQIVNFIQYNVSDPTKFLLGLPEFLMGYIRKNFDKDYILNKNVAEELDNTLGCYNLTVITDAMKSIDSRSYVPRDYAIRKLFLLGFDFNTSLYQVSSQPDYMSSASSVTVQDTSSEEVKPIKNNQAVQTLQAAIFASSAMLTEGDL